jgi:hypothetical protein
LRAYTPDDAKALTATVSTFPRSSYDLEELLTQLGTGEAVVTVLSEKGAPTPVAWTRLRAPLSLMAPSDPALVSAAVGASPLTARYGQAVDRESAYELLNQRLATAPGPDDAAAAPAPAPAPREEAPSAPRRQAQEESMVEKVVTSSAFKSALRSAGTVLGREITRSIFGTARRRR